MRMQSETAVQPKEAPGTAIMPVLEGDFQDIRPVVTAEQAKRAMELYQELVTAVTDESDYQTFRDSDQKQHKFRKRSGWKKLERFFFVSIEIRQEQVIHQHGPSCMRLKLPDITDCGCPIKGARCVVRALDTRSGRFSDNSGVCVIGERRLSPKSSLHDLQTRAFNRAANRATADLLGVSDPSAEEKGAESGYSKEERQELADVWKVTPPEDQQRAIAYLKGAGFEGKDDRAIYIAFLQRGTEENLTEVLDLLRGPQDGSFDPDDVPLPEAT